MTNTHHNNFDFIRFAAAMMVWYGHCYALFAEPVSPIAVWIPFGGTGVSIFFVISGYFVTASYEHHKRLLPFLRNRALRILPAMIVVILLSVLVLGPLVTSLSLHDYFFEPETWRYLRSLLIFPLQYNLPGVFNDTPTSAVNGSLWTLQHEVRCYAFVALFGAFSLLRPHVAMIVFAGLCFTLIYGTLANVDLLPQFFFISKWEKFRLAAELGTFFAGGAIMYLARERIPLRKEFFAAACLVLVISSHLLTANSTPLQRECVQLVNAIALSYAVIYFGYLKLPKLHNFSTYGDFSYGMYLYAFPMQQLAFQLWRHAGFAVLTALSFVLTFACAVMSWHCIEKPALSLKE